MRRVGVLMSLRQKDVQSEARIKAFLQGLDASGWVDGGNMRVAYRWGGGNRENMSSFAAELITLQPDVILAGGSEAVMALQQSTRTVPIVFTNVADPVGAGFVNSLSQPGGNVTGFLLFEYGISPKWLEL